MKRIMTLVAVLCIVAASQAQTLQGLFDKYCDDERFEYVCVGKGMMNMASVLGGMARNDKDIASKMRSVKILSLNAESTSALLKTVVRDLDLVVDKGHFETAVEARDKGEKVHIYYRITGKDNADMLIVAKEKGKLSLIWLTGKMSKEEMMHTFSSTGNMIQYGTGERS